MFDLGSGSSNKMTRLWSRLGSLVALVVGLAAVSVTAHPGWIPNTAIPSHGRAIFLLRVPHGCGPVPHSATDKVIVHISPTIVESVTELTPVKNYHGWETDVEMGHLDGHEFPLTLTLSATSNSSETTISGDEIGEFKFQARFRQNLDIGQKILFPVEQHCVDGQVELWNGKNAPHIVIVGGVGSSNSEELDQVQKFAVAALILAAVPWVLVCVVAFINKSVRSRIYARGRNDAIEVGTV